MRRLVNEESFAYLRLCNSKFIIDFVSRYGVDLWLECAYKSKTCQGHLKVRRNHHLINLAKCQTFHNLAYSNCV